MDELFQNNIVDKYNGLVIKYIPVSDKYYYRAFSHQKGMCKDLGEILLDDIVYFSYDDDELNGKMNFLLEDLRKAAVFAIENRLPKRYVAKSDGLAGELLLDVMIRIEEKESELLIARPKYTEVGSKNEIKGYDALFFADDGNYLKLYLGQVKSGKKEYCQRGINEDLNLKYDKKYFTSNIAYIADRCDSKRLEEFLSKINRACFYENDEVKKSDRIKEVFKENNVKVIIPCLLVYSSDIYNNIAQLKKNIEIETNRIKEYFDEKSFPIDVLTNYEIKFWVFPVESIDLIRKKIADFKKETLNG